MSKYAAVVAATQPMIDYMDAIDAGNRELAERKYQDAMRGLDVLESSGRIARTKQTMRLESQAGARAEALFPSQLRLSETGAGQAAFELAESQRKAKEEADALERVKSMINENPRVLEMLSDVAVSSRRGAEAKMATATIAEQQRQGYIPKLVGAQTAEQQAAQEEALTAGAAAKARRTYVEEEAAAAGAKATYDKLSAMADIRNMPVEEIARREEAESREWQAKLKTGVAINEMDYIASDKQRSIELVKEQISMLKKRGQLYDAQILDALAKKQADDMAVLKEVRALASDIQSAYMALARLEAGEDVLEQLAKIGSASGMKMDLGTMAGDAGNREAIKQNIIAHISILRSLINRHGYHYDNTSVPPVFRTLSPSELRMPPGGGATVQYEQYRRDLPKSAPQTYREPARRLGPPEPATEAESDIDTMFDILGE